MKKNVRIYSLLIIVIIATGTVVIYRHINPAENPKTPHLDYGPQARLCQYPNLLPPEVTHPYPDWMMVDIRRELEKELSKVRDGKADLLDLAIIKDQTEMLHIPLEQFFTPDEWFALCKPALERSILEFKAKMTKHPKRWNEWDGRRLIKSNLESLGITIESLGMTPQQLMDTLRGKKE